MVLEGASRSEVVRWKAVDVGGRTLYLEVRIRTFTLGDGSLGSLTVSPLAIVVMEHEQEYAVPLALDDDESLGGQLFEAMF